MVEQHLIGLTHLSTRTGYSVSYIRSLADAGILPHQRDSANRRQFSEHAAQILERRRAKRRPKAGPH